MDNQQPNKSQHKNINRFLKWGKFMKIQNRLNLIYKNKVKLLKIENENLEILCLNCNLSFRIKKKRIFDKKEKTCPNCRKRNRIEEKERLIINECKKRNYMLISNYSGSKNKIELKHLSCGNSYKVTPNNFLRGRSCPFCSNKKPPKDFSEFLDLLEEKNGEYESLSSSEEFKDTFTKMKILHKKCGNILEMSYQDLKNHNCKFCAHQSYLKDLDKFKEEINLKYNGEIIVIGDYINNKKAIKFKCNLCNKYFYNTPVSILDKRKMRACNCRKISNGETIISNYLSNKNIKFIREFRFNDCRDKRPLPFDFYIKEFNILIEFDGEHHYFPIYGKERFEITVKHDLMKDNYCKDNNIELIRIRYDDDLNCILDNLVQRLSK